MTGCILTEKRAPDGTLIYRQIMCRVRTEDEIARAFASSDDDDSGEPDPFTPRDDFGDPSDADTDFDDHDIDEDGLPADQERDDGHDLPYGMSLLNLDDELMDSDMIGSGVLAFHHRIRDRITVVPEDTSDL